MEILISIVAKIAEYLVTPLVHPCTYLCSYKTNCENLKNEIRKLKVARDSVQQRVDASKIKGEEIEQNVEGWLSSVEKIIDEVGKVIEEEEKSNHQCFKGLCPNFKNRYHLSKKAVKEVKAISGLQEEGRFEQVSHPTIPEEIWLKTSQGYMQFESRKSILNGILDALRNPQLNIIGVYGMGGIGKTTLVKEVARQAKEDKLFNKIISAYVSQTPDIIKIQGEIAEKLGLEFKEQAETLRAGRLYERLKKESKILIILDDIWGILDLEAIGIPLGDDNSGRKVLLTSRIEDVLSCKMDSQRIFLVDVLNEMETWSLFKKMAGDCIENGELKSVARAVAKECAGLPIAIVPVATVLRNKRLFEWQDALLQLRRPSPRNFTGIQEKAYSAIALSYNHLEKELKNIFLLIGYTYITSINDLLILGMGLGMFEGINKMEDAQIRVRALVNKLKTSCMLLADTIGYRDFSMHDVVRDVALSIASRDQHVFTARNEPVDQWYENEQNIYTSLVLHDVKSSEFLEVLECPQLKFFSMDSHNSSITIPDEFFMTMKELRVLNLSSMRLLSLPSSLCCLINLRTLRLYKCELANIADIGDLKKLEILCLRGSNIEHLPVQVGQLTRLRLLDLRECDNLEVVPPNVISCLFHLEELYMGRFAEWEMEGLNNERRNASLEELKHLSNLTTLQIRIKDVKTLPRDLFFTTLERYEILIGEECCWCDYGHRSCKKVQLELVNADICLKDGHLMQLKGIDYLCLLGSQNMNNVLYGLDRDGFPQLKILHVEDNSNLLCVVEATDCAPHNAFPLLESLYLQNLIELEKICCGRLTVEAFSNLKEIAMKNCKKLKNIFSFSIAVGLQRLQLMEVWDCQNMEEIFAIEREDESNNNGDVIELNQLRSLRLHLLPQLTSFCSKLKTSSILQQKRDESITEITSANEIDVFDAVFNRKVVLPNLETLELYAIKCENIWHNQLGGTSCCVKKLTHLNVSCCHKLKYIFSSSMVSNLVLLQHLEVSNCDLLEEIVAKERGEESAIKFVFPRVSFLSLKNLQKLRAFYPGIYTSEWPVLKSLEIDDSFELIQKIFISDIHSFQDSNKEGQSDIQAPQHVFSVEKVFPNLKELEIIGEGITMKWQGQFPEKLFHKLKVVEMLHDKSTVLPLGLLQRLETLKLERNSYKEIFSYEQVDEQDRVILAQLKYLKLFGLNHLKHLWKEDLNLQNLTVLNVLCCDGLLSLVTPPIVKTLFRLQTMNICSCKMMTEIVANGGVAKDEIVFNELKLLNLNGLNNLTSFCFDNYTFNFPSLKILDVADCPKMKIFSNGVVCTPKLERVRLNWKECWVGDLNTTFQHFNKKKKIQDSGEPSTQHQE